MYIYLVNYYGHTIAAAKDDEQADAVIQQYIRNNSDMFIENFEKEPIRYFRGDEDGIEDQEG